MEPGFLSFRCNICGQACVERVEGLAREVASCKSCGSTVRWRSIIRVLSLELFGKNLALPDFPLKLDITGIGMSDWEGYAVPLTHKLDYVNTYFHEEPKLDISSIDPALEGTFDFVISSDVFEHVNPPVSRAFENVRKLLKPSGVLILTVPYDQRNETIEHFPELHDYRVIKRHNRYTLINRTQQGVLQTFDNLVFHGGPGATLEMRVFSESSLIEELKKGGFESIRIYKTPDFDHGIYDIDSWDKGWALPIAARRSALLATTIVTRSGAEEFTAPPSQNSGRAGASLAANPNPIPSGAGAGTTTVSWSTGDGSWGRVYVSTDGGSEELFGEGAEGSAEAPWINEGTIYEFRLYAVEVSRI